MPNNDIAIIKVGKKSTLRLRGIRAYRAVTVSELISLTRDNSDRVKLIVVESITDKEYQPLCNFARGLKGGNTKIVFFCSSRDEVTSGAADELDCDTFTDTKLFYETVGKQLGIAIDPDLNVQAEAFKEAFVMDSEEFTGFEAFNEAVETIKSAVHEDKQDTVVDLPDLVSKYDITEEFSDNDLGIETEEPEKKPGEPNKSENNNQRTQINTSSLIKNQQNDAGVSAEELKLANDLAKAFQDKADTAIKQAETLKAENETLKTNAASSAKRLEEAVGKINELNKVIKAVKDEKKVLELELSKLETLEIIEDPVTLEEFNSVKAELSSLKSGESVSSHELEEVKTQLDSATATIEELEALKKSLEEQLDEFSNTIKIYESNAEEQKKNLMDALAKCTILEQEIDRLKNDDSDRVALADAQRKISDTQAKLTEAMDRVSELTYKVKNGANNRIVLMDMVKSAVEKLAVYEKVIEGQKNDINRMRSDNYSLQDTITALQSDRDELKAQVESHANSNTALVQTSRAEIDKINNEKILLAAQVENLRSQLIAKENQYNTLIQNTGGDETGGNLVAKNNALEELARTLRSELSKAKKEADDNVRELMTYKESVDRLADENRTMKQKMGALASGISGGGASVIGHLNPSGRGLIIPVFGSGSYGVTTSAVSLAYHLASNSKVVFIDMDLISAKSDSWFGLPLLNQVDGIPSNSKRSTGLGVFFDRGFNYFSENYDKLILRKVKLKGGSIDYIGGLYFKIDPLKLASADFNGLLTLCKNNYDYVVIDCGRLGASELNDQLTCALANASYRSVAVTPSEFIEVRNFRNLMQECHIDITKIAWLLNMAHNTKVNDKMKNMLSATKYSQVPFMDNLFELTDNGYKKKHFMQEKMSRDKFSYFVNSCVFNK